MQLSEGISVESYSANAVEEAQRAKELVSLGRYDEAIETLCSYMNRTEQTPELLADVGTMCRRLNRGSQAVEFFRQADILRGDKRGDPKGKATLYANWASALYDLGRFTEAHELAVRSYAAWPNPLALYSLATTRLTLGNFEHGWPLFAKRATLPIYTAGADYGVEEWDGETTCERLLLIGEQGMGERIMFASAFEDAAERSGAHLHIELTKEVARLAPLFQRSFPAARIVFVDDDLMRAGTKQILMGDAARLLRPTFDSFPKHKGYLKLDPARRDAVRAKIPGEGPIIGLSWRSKNTAFGQFKGMTLEDLLPILRIPGARFVNLQYGDHILEAEIMKFVSDHKVTIRQPLKPLELFDDVDACAHLIGACDRVVTISNINAHLAGALGVPTSLILRGGYGTVWYWFTKEESPWYPATRIYRPVGVGQSAVIEKVAAEIVGGLNGSAAGT